MNNVANVFFTAIVPALIYGFILYRLFRHAWKSIRSRLRLHLPGSSYLGRGLTTFRGEIANPFYVIAFAAGIAIVAFNVFFQRDQLFIEGQFVAILSGIVICASLILFVALVNTFFSSGKYAPTKVSW